MVKFGLVMLMFVGAIAGPAVAEDPVYFADPRLKAIVEAQIGKTDPTPTDMLDLTAVNAESKGITSMKGLEYALNLSWVNFHACWDISDVSPLAGLTKLNCIELGHNNISDISPLAGSTRIRWWLRLDSNPLNREAYSTTLAQIAANNPGIELEYDDSPWAPDGVAASDGTYEDKVRVTWNALDNGPGADRNTFSYVVERSESLNGPRTVVSNWLYHTTSFDDKSVVRGVHYWYWVTDTLNWRYGQPDEGFAFSQQTLNMSSSTGGTVNSPGIGAFRYGYGDVVAIGATAATNYHFVNWTGTAVSAGKVANASSASTTVAVDADYTLQANFAIDKRTLTTSVTAGGSVNAPGMGGFQYDHGTAVAVAATAATNYHFVNWTGSAVSAGKVADASSASTTVALDADYTLQANFAIDKRTLTAGATAGGSVSAPGMGGFQYDHGTTVSVAATAATNYHFVNWTGSAVSAGKVANAGSANTTVAMDADYTLQANFAIDKRTLTTSATAGGSVNAPGMGGFQYDHGTTVSVAASAATNYHFVNWTGSAVSAGKVANAGSANTTVAVDGDYTLQANFALDKRTLTTSATAGGSVNAPGMGGFQYDHGTTVSVAATAATNYHFVNWTGTAVSAGKVANASVASTTVAVDADYTLQANFAIDKRTLTTSATAGGSVNAPGMGGFQYDHGTAVSVAATAATNYHFVNWTGTAVSAGKVANASLASTTVAVDADYTLQANFAIDKRTLTAGATSGGSVNAPGMGSFQYDHGTTVSVAATAATNYHFVNWTGSAVSAGKVADPAAASTTVAVDADCTLQANFAIDERTLTTIASAGGTVSSPGAGTFQYDHGSKVSVTATAGPSYTFARWTGTAVSAGKVADPSAASTTVTLDADCTLQANFEVISYTLTITSTAGGSVVAPIAGAGTYRYTAGEIAWIEARPDSLFRFIGWRGCLYADDARSSITMNNDCAVRAHFESVLDTIYVDDNAPSDPGPGDLNVSDPLQNGTADRPFDGIQKAIEVAKKGAKVIIRPGTYFETIDLLGKSIELNGLDCSGSDIAALPIINGQGKNAVVTCGQAEDSNCVLCGLVITGGKGRVAGGIVCSGSSPSIVNCLIVGNRVDDPNVAGYIGDDSQDCVNGGALYCRDSSATFVNCTIAGNWGVSGGPGLGFRDSKVTIANSIVWGNGPVEIMAQGAKQPTFTYTDIRGGWLGVGNKDGDPLFALPGYWANPEDLAQKMDGTEPEAVWVKGDYHLRSQTGRWDAILGWVKDSMTSPCIDAGDPSSRIGQETQPNGLRVNMGAYGATCQASRSK